MLAISPLSSGVIIVVEVICKLIGANLVRLVMYMQRKRGKGRGMNGRGGKKVGLWEIFMEGCRKGFT